MKQIVFDSISRDQIPSYIPDPDQLLIQLYELLSSADDEERPDLANAIYCLIEVAKVKGPRRAVERLCSLVAQDRDRFSSYNIKRHVKNVFRGRASH